MRNSACSNSNWITPQFGDRASTYTPTKVSNLHVTLAEHADMSTNT